MPAPRAWQREARLLIIADLIGPGSFGAPVDDVMAIDFLLQHPSVLSSFIRLGTRQWPMASSPSDQETDSAEETLLQWKRVVGGEAVAPLIGRLIARQLLVRRSPTNLALTREGRQLAVQLEDRLDAHPNARLTLVAREFVTDASGAVGRLRRSIEPGGSD